MIDIKVDQELSAETLGHTLLITVLNLIRLNLGTSHLDTNQYGTYR